MPSSPLTSSHSQRDVLIRSGFALLCAFVVMGSAQGSAAQSELPVDRVDALAAVAKPARAVLQQASVRYGVSHPLASFEGLLDTSHVASTILFDENAPEKTSGSVTVDLLGFSSGNKARDKHAQRSLQTRVFPSATLQLRGLQQIEMQEVDDSERARLRGSCQADLLLHGQQSAWPVAVDLEWSDDELIVLSSFTVLLDDFSIRRDKLFGMPIRNEVPVSVELRYRRP
ncbi:MAG TPA: hypothetical protein DIU15_15750 [Deltaproteobacteria bacterium]|nr:hypothetical protein [Deltaproteobacteria bacterium]HCP47495.1 hypothetical protein [Deltaproteobacteria bacterium]